MSDLIIGALMLALLVATQAHGDEVILPPCDYVVNPKPAPRWNENCYNVVGLDHPKTGVDHGESQEASQDLEIL
jgi:hypothetical protein